MEKKNYINNIIQACNKVLEYEKLVNDLGDSIEELFWDIVLPESVRDELAEHTDELDEFEKAMEKLRYALRVARIKAFGKFGDLFDTSNTAATSLFNLYWSINHIKNMSSEDVLAIRSIMGQVKLLRDTLIWVRDEV